MDGLALNIITQLFGGLGVLFSILSFQQRSSRHIVLFQAASNFFWFLHMFLLGAVAGILLNLISFLRSILFSMREKHAFARKKCWYPIVILLLCGAGVLSYFMGDGWKAILPTVGMILSTLSLGSEKPSRVRLLFLSSCPLWLAYDALNLSIPGVFAELFNMTSIIIGMVRLDRGRTKS